MTAKANAISHAIADALKQRLASTGIAIAEGADSSGNPTIQLGAGTAGAAGGLIRIVPQEWALAKDVLGLTANIYTPHSAQICFEANVTSGSGADVNTIALQSLVFMEVALHGTRVDVFQTANGTAPVLASFVESNRKATFDGSIFQGMIANQ
ncbi:hypothetical protein UFOVP75_88 [uncultured Caudovirales phage]|uniref:Uncharacterized protein n=1 Tax=uncultured Caudovirales phage TaxID=2100421 RepID=A0A6J5L3W5_9CAUD|nr:hypothetical protein UFOVP75_88 [uncultured Caudovirales phage]